MKKHTTVLLGILVSATALHCGDSAADCAETKTCASTPDASNDGTATGDGGPDGTVPIPEGCDPNADPKDAPKCVVSDFGIFVDAATGNDGNSGSKELPMKSIAGALAKLNGRPRIYVCEGTYPESVKLTSATTISIFGGFACGTWSYTGAKAKLSPSSAGVVLSITGTSAAIVVADIEATALDAQQMGESSIAVLVASASAVALRRVVGTAGEGRDGADAIAQPDFDPTVAPDGTSGATGGTETINPKCTSSRGGRGGNDATPNGITGQIAVSSVYPNFATGAGGSTGGTCAQGLGANGSYGVAGAAGAGAATLGTLDATGWKPAGGSAGGTGGDGQGGGGGAQTVMGGIGGSGAPGGCGGAGGSAGGAGGASIALGIFESALVLEQSTLVAKGAGRGGNGGQGQKAQLGGTKGSTNGANACDGGFGGIGGSGGGGGGGAGGVSVGILYKGATPKIDGVDVVATDTHPVVTLGQKGAGGTKGAGGAAAQAGAPVSRVGNEGTDGLAGEAKAVMTVP